MGEQPSTNISWSVASSVLSMVKLSSYNHLQALFVLITQQLGSRIRCRSHANAYWYIKYTETNTSLSLIIAHNHTPTHTRESHLYSLSPPLSPLFVKSGPFPVSFYLFSSFQYS